MTHNTLSTQSPDAHGPRLIGTRGRRRLVTTMLLAAIACLLAPIATNAATAPEPPSQPSEPLSEAPPGEVRCANLIYGKNKTSVCFADQFLAQIKKDAGVRAQPRFTAVRLDSDEVYQYPFAVMTGEGRFSLTVKQRENMRNYLTRGGFMVASPGCSNRQWAQSFQDELKLVFPNLKLKTLDMSHPVFHTVYNIRQLSAKRSGSNPTLQGLEIDGKIVLIYSKDGLNDTSNAGGNCCCCGGNEIRNAREINVNLLAYALTH